MNLWELNGEQSKTTIYKIFKQLFMSKMKEGTDVGDHALKIINLIG